MVQPIKVSAGTTTNGVPPGTMISQSDLQLYQRLKPMAEQFKHLVQELKAALEARAEVEPGLLTAELHVRHQRRRLQRFLFARLGLTRKQIKALRKQAPQVEYRSVAIVPANEPTASGNNQAANTQPK